MNGLRLLSGLGVAGLLLALVGCGGTTTKTPVDAGYRGPARFNHYMAAAELLSQAGVPAESTPQLRVIPDYNAFLMVPASFVESRGMAEEIAYLVEDGGHVAVVFYEAPMAMDWTRYDRMEAVARFRPDADDLPDTPLLDRYGISFEVDTRSNLVERSQVVVDIEGESLSVGLPNHSGFRYDGHLASGSIRSGGGDLAGFLSLPTGSGRLTLINDSRPFANRYLAELDHARFLWLLSQLEYSDEALIVYGSDLSFFGMLLHYGWIPLTALALFLAIWLARNLPRFGPLRPSPVPGNREFAEHIRTSGQFLWRHHRSGSLIEPLRRSILKRFQSGVLVQDAEPAWHRLAEQTGVPEHRVHAAMTRTDVRDPALMTRIMQDLQAMDQRL